MLVQREWTVEQFRSAYADTATSLYRKAHAVSDRTAKRWVAGAIDRPHPVSRRVLETMFDADVKALFGPPTATAGRDTSLVPGGMVTDAQTGDDGDAMPTAPAEVSSANRRDLLNAGIALATTTATGDPLERAERISRAMAAAAPDPLTLAQLQHGIHYLAGSFAATSLTELTRPIERAWNDAESLLETRVSGGTRRDLESVAGQYAFYRGRLAADMGDDTAALTFLVLAGQHAKAAGDTLLSGSVAAMRSELAFFAGDFGGAAAIAAEGAIGAHPYLVPVLAGSCARAFAQVGDTDATLTALRTMSDNVWTGKIQPGVDPGDEEAYEAYSAIALGYLGHGDTAEVHARNSLALVGREGRHMQLAGTHLALARAFIRRSKPEPELAAAALRDALHAGQRSGGGRTTGRAVGIYQHLAANPRWARLPAVRDLGALLREHRSLAAASAV
ncbi:hypothetical protein [Pseudofrankia saprophytica]|uniref:hypothetical protein n=1 Tax=Pseudofrankia saprophytica TaxID=298655 RepID=UPI001E427C89|nr:hypothetical protein [Pseudofrankia saprophytica]